MARLLHSTLAFVIVASASMSALAYDATWYRADSWSGEYPHGFTMTADVILDIRRYPDPGMPKSISCLLKRGATYHPWNGKRVTSDQLEFLSFTKISTFEVNATFTSSVARKPDGHEMTIKFEKGDRWSYLAGLAEGAFLFKFGNTIYVGDQDLFAKSNEIGKSTDNNQSGYDEWLHLTCANGASGWIFFNEMGNAAAFATPHIDAYGVASDLPLTEPMQKTAQVPLTKPSSLNVSTSIPMKRDGGTYAVPVIINNAITLDFIVDSGASDVSIPADVVSTLFRTGTIDKSDFIGTRTYKLADGSTVPSVQFRIRSLKVGDREIKNVVASLASSKGSLLLGQSFLSRFKSWSINNAKHELLLDGEPDNASLVTEHELRSEVKPKINLKSTKRIKQHVSLGYMNLRSGPGLDQKVLTRVPAGMEVVIKGQCVMSQDNVSRYSYCPVEWNGVEGWISSSGLE